MFGVQPTLAPSTVGYLPASSVVYQSQPMPLGGPMVQQPVYQSQPLGGGGLAVNPMGPQQGGYAPVPQSEPPTAPAEPPPPYDQAPPPYSEVKEK